MCCNLEPEMSGYRKLKLISLEWSIKRLAWKYLSGSFIFGYLY